MSDPIKFYFDLSSPYGYFAVRTDPQRMTVTAYDSDVHQSS